VGKLYVLDVLLVYDIVDIRYPCYNIRTRIHWL